MNEVHIHAVACVVMLLTLGAPAGTTKADVVINMPPPPAQPQRQQPSASVLPDVQTAAASPTTGNIALARYGRYRARPSNIAYARSYRAPAYPYSWSSPYSTYAPYGGYSSCGFGYFGSGLFTFRVIGSSY